MDQFSGRDYVKIAIANAYGLDKDSWHKRIAWVNNHQCDLKDYADKADKPLLFIKGVYALDDAINGIATGYIMDLDSTASGYQIMAALSGCHKTAENTNIKFTGQREDLYTKIANEMNKLLPKDRWVKRSDLKKAVMTVGYGSKAQPKRLFGEDTPELEAFYRIMYRELPGAMEVMEIIQSCWRDDVLAHEWTLPDGHVAKVNVMDIESKKIEIDELDHKTFEFQTYVNKPTNFGLSLAANVIHSIDGYIVREIVRRAYGLGFEVVTIHDAFFCSPNHMNEVRKLYVTILTEINRSNLLQDILNEIVGDPNNTFKQFSNDLGDYIKKSEYALS